MNSDIKLDFKDVLILPKNTTLKSRKEINLETEYITLHSKQKIKCVPIIASNMDTTGTFSMAEELSKYKILTLIHKYYSINEWYNIIKSCKWDDIKEYIFITVGTKEKDLCKLYQLIEMTKINKICIDVANGYCSTLLDTLQVIRKKYPKHIIMAGNICTSEGAEAIINSGADIVKIGVGSGSVCTTRIKTGIGYPQFSCIRDTIKSVNNLGALLCSDGGCINPGDISKAYGGGAHFVCLGGMLAGHIEGEQDVNENNEIEFYGMSSRDAMEKYSETKKVDNYKTSEGKKVFLKCKGQVKHTIQDILGGISSTCTYTNSKNITELQNNIKFIRVLAQSNEIFGKN